MFVYDVCARFGWPAPDWLDRPPLSLPSVTPGDLVSFDTPIHVSEDIVSGNTSLLENVVINKLVQHRHPRRIFEIGTFDGRTTLTMAANAPKADIFTLDLPPDHANALPLAPNDRRYIDKPESGGRFKGTPYAQRITQLFGDSATFDYRPFDHSVDVVFVDGSHAYDYVRSDSEAALRMATPGGLILWHDYGAWDGVTRALNELHQCDPRFRDARHIAGTSLATLTVPSAPPAP
jgi:hypothetical protein